MLLRLILIKIKTVLRRNGQKCLTYVVHHQAGQVSWQLFHRARNAPNGSSILFGLFPKCLQYFVSLADKFSSAVRTSPTESLIPFTCGSNGLYKTLGTLSQYFLAQFFHLWAFPLANHVCNSYGSFKTEDATDEFKNHQSSSPDRV
jgi:hypothetical protein